MTGAGPSAGSRRILYVDFAPSLGGSIRSLLQVLEHLPRERYRPLALLAPGVASLPEMRALDIPIFAYDAGQGRAIRYSPAAEQVRASRTADWVRRQAILGAAWRQLSLANRLWRRTRPAMLHTAGIISAQDVHLVHMNDALPLAEPGVLAAWVRRRPSVVTVRSFAPLDSFHRLISRLPAAGVFTSAAIRDDLHRQGASFRREEVIFNAIDLQEYEAMPDRQGVRAEFGLPPDARIACVVGRLMRRKGIDVFIQALARVIPDHPDLYALVVGEEEITDIGLQAELQDLARRLGVAEHVRFCGLRRDVPRLLLASDLLSFVPTLAEPFGRVVVEAMAAGLPVVGARSGAIPDIMVEGVTGLLVPPADAEAQARAMGRILADAEMAAKMGAAGRARARAMFSIEHQVERLVVLYDAILARSAERGRSAS
ncbi:MAG: glycosyltransferase family 1 protein [Caldilineae bacterium]|nr:MAG: glycosyltransferase family 1 protein [Caldilineae bacterium]